MRPGPTSPLKGPAPPPAQAKKEPAATATSSAALPAVPPSAAATAGGRSEFVNRAVFTLIMAYTFLALVAMGIVVVLPVILLIKMMMFYEVLRINLKERKEKHSSLVFQVIPYYFLAVTVVVITLFNLREPLQEDFPIMRSAFNSFGLVVFLLYMMGFVLFVLSLRKGMYRYQIGVFAWMAMTLIFIVVQGSLQTTNMVRGMIWFLLPISCVVHNDIWAYACGKSFGRTPLLRLSPKKTLEGFIGAWIMTTIWAFWFAGFLSCFPQLICPKVSFTQPAECVPDATFAFHTTAVPTWVTALTLGFVRELQVNAVQYHAVVLAAFASLLAPFGGFFASGLKRAFKLKDFGTLIPGHGGMTDRMDCQIIMGMFTFVYLESYVYPRQSCPSPIGMLDCIRQLPVDTQRMIASEILGGLGTGGSASA